MALETEMSYLAIAVPLLVAYWVSVAGRPHAPDDQDRRLEKRNWRVSFGLIANSGLAFWHSQSPANVYLINFLALLVTTLCYWSNPDYDTFWHHARTRIAGFIVAFLLTLALSYWAPHAQISVIAFSLVMAHGHQKRLKNALEQTSEDLHFAKQRIIRLESELKLNTHTLAPRGTDKQSA